MRFPVILRLAFTALFMMGLASNVNAADAKPKPLKVGDRAPDFKLKGTDGKEYRLAEFKGKSAVVVVWYPRALTGG